jgi:hypothetical protein
MRVARIQNVAARPKIFQDESHHKVSKLDMKVFALALVVAHTSASPWIRGDTVHVSVDTSNFAYNVSFPADDAEHCSLSEGTLAFYCKGVGYTTADKLDAGWKPLRLISRPRQIRGQDPRLGPFEAIVASWQGGNSSACTMTSAIRFFPEYDAFVFFANFSSAGVPNTNATERLPFSALSRPPTTDLPLSTAFPSWPVSTRVSSACMSQTYHGNSLKTNFRRGALATWVGGLEGGPLLLYPPKRAAHPPALILSPLTHAKSVIGSPVGSRVAFGVQGYVEELPPAFSQAVLMVGRLGVRATQMAWGQTLRAHANTRRLSLDQDVLNSKVTYWTDNGAYYCYCNNPVQPMHVTVAALRDYHRSLGLNISLYHFDPFWHSGRADGRCEGAFASNWSASEYHWPSVRKEGDGLGTDVWGSPGEKGAISFQLLYSLLAGPNHTVARPGNETARGNVYGDGKGPMGGPWPMQNDDYGLHNQAMVRGAVSECTAV